MMQNLATSALLFLVMAIATSAQAAPVDSLLADTSWESFAGKSALSSFAWAGEDENLLSSRLGRTAVTVADADLDSRMLTGLAAPEPPALVLAGMAFGGVICGRSLLARRRRQLGEAASDTCES
jgi:hypothetical protein